MEVEHAHYENSENEDVYVKVKLAVDHKKIEYSESMLRVLQKNHAVVQMFARIFDNGEYGNGGHDYIIVAPRNIDANALNTLRTFYTELFVRKDGKHPLFLHGPETAT